MNIKKHIPNTITCCNLVSGCIATSYAFGGSPKMALLWIIIGAVFDFFDGMSARLLHVSSPIGKELDSLADDVTFGVAPATIVFSELAVLEYPGFLQQTTSFIGMPTPANALFWGSLIVLNPFWLEGYSWSWLVILALVVITSLLLVCELPMFALKFKQWSFKGNEIKYIFACIAILSMVLFMTEDGWLGMLEAWWLIISLYFVISLILYLKKK